MKRFLNILCCIGAVLFLLAAALCYHEARVSAGAKYETVYDTIPWFDTIRIIEPIPIREEAVRIDTVWMERADKDPLRSDASLTPLVPLEEGTVPLDSLYADSLPVQVPIMQKVYSTPDYTAYVSGYQASLDSVNIYRMQYSLEPRPPDKTSRWGLSAGTGVAWTPEGLKPALFVGVSYTFKRF